MLWNFMKFWAKFHKISIEISTKISIEISLPYPRESIFRSGGWCFLSWSRFSAPGPLGCNLKSWSLFLASANLGHLGVNFEPLGVAYLSSVRTLRASRSQSTKPSLTWGLCHSGIQFFILFISLFIYLFENDFYVPVVY